MPPYPQTKEAKMKAYVIIILALSASVVLANRIATANRDSEYTKAKLLGSIIGAMIEIILYAIAIYYVVKL